MCITRNEKGRFSRKSHECGKLQRVIYSNFIVVFLGSNSLLCCSHNSFYYEHVIRFQTFHQWNKKLGGFAIGRAHAADCHQRICRKYTDQRTSIHCVGAKRMVGGYSSRTVIACVRLSVSANEQKSERAVKYRTSENRREEKGRVL